MKLKALLQGLTKAIADEAEQNPEFARRIEVALGIDAPSTPSDRKPKRGGNRRAPPLFDPIEAAHQGEQVLRQRLNGLDIEQLKDIIADYGMDTGKLVMKWKSPERIVDRIVEFSLSRSTKGDVFLK